MSSKQRKIIRREFEECVVVDWRGKKVVRSPGYNYTFDKTDGMFFRYGKTVKEDPVMAPFFEILDWEISEQCDNGCPFCYKSNTNEGKTITLDTFKAYMDKIVEMNPILCQVAFGVGSLKYLPDLDKMLIHTRRSNVIPNITISCFEDDSNGIDAIKQLCGACAISNYNWEKTLSMAIHLKNKSSLAQVNVHQLLSQETFAECVKILESVKDLTYRSINPITAIVFLWVKPKGRAVDTYHPVNQDMLNQLIDYAMDNKISIGFDSCSAPSVLQNTKMKKFETLIEPCESSIFSAYLDVDGNFLPCSFSEGVVEPVHIDSVKTVDDLWYSIPYSNFRTDLLNSCRSCPLYSLTSNE